MHSKRIKKKVKEDYNAIAKDFSNTRHFPWAEFDFFLPYYDKNFKVLDVGCGNGRLLQFLNKHGYKDYLGIDQSEGLLKHAQENYPKNKFVLADMSDFKPKDSFDAVFAIASFHHLPPSEHLSTLKNWNALLPEGGYLFMTNWNLFQCRFWPLWVKSLLNPTYGFALLVPFQKEVKRYYYAFTRRRLKKLLEKAGFKVLEQHVGKNIVTIAQK